MLYIFILISLKISIVSFEINFDFRLTYISLVASLPLLILSKQKMRILKNVDWKTLIFFISMFILMQSVWNSGFIQKLIANMNINITNLLMIYCEYSTKPVNVKCSACCTLPAYVA